MTASSLHDPVAALMRRVARDIVLPRFRNLAAADIEEKSPGDYVTIADRESEAALAAGLAAIDSGTRPGTRAATRPGTRIVGEEACAADPAELNRLGEGRLWLIDPIDGTGNFAAGRAPFGIMIALVEDGVPQAGWILDPLAGRLCHAFREGGAFVDGERVTARRGDASLPIAAVAARSPEEHARWTASAAGRLTLVDIPRCAAEQYPRLALAANDIALFGRTMPWDHAAGALFVEEAGGRVARPNGAPYRVGDIRPGLLAAASPALWELGREVFCG